MIAIAQVGKLLDRHSYMAPNVALDEDASWKLRWTSQEGNTWTLC